MGHTTDQIIQIVDTGCGLIIDAKSKTKDQLIKIAMAAKKKNIRITIKDGGSKTTAQLIEIAIICPANIILDLSE